MEELKREISEEELETEEIKNPFEYDKDKLIKEIDDTWIREEDREKLVLYLKEATSIEFPWAEQSLAECIILKKYYNVIEKMDRKQYEEDTKNPLKSVLSILS
mgnify:CR=1 FL=1